MNKTESNYDVVFNFDPRSMKLAIARYLQSRGFVQVTDEGENTFVHSGTEGNFYLEYKIKDNTLNISSWPDRLQQAKPIRLDDDDERSPNSYAMDYIGFTQELLNYILRDLCHYSDEDIKKYCPDYASHQREERREAAKLSMTAPSMLSTPTANTGMNSVGSMPQSSLSGVPSGNASLKASQPANAIATLLLIGACSISFFTLSTLGTPIATLSYSIFALVIIRIIEASSGGRYPKMFKFLLFFQKFCIATASITLIIYIFLGAQVLIPVFEAIFGA